jgi:DNA-binding NtrC family response regulator
MDKPILEQLERLIIEQFLKANDGNKSKTAKDLNMHRPRLYAKLKKFGLSTGFWSQRLAP